MSETYPSKKPLRNAFRRTYFPSSVGIGCKGTENLRDVQEKLHFLVIFYSAGYRRALDCQKGAKILSVHAEW